MKFSKAMPEFFARLTFKRASCGPLVHREIELIPDWAKELKEIIQDQIDTNLALSLKEVSQSLNVHPTYLSREFSKYFDDLSFGDYIRKLRIEKSIQLLNESGHSLAEIAYLTGFSDQSHFNRIFKKYTGKNPSEYRKSQPKSKENTNCKFYAISNQ